jgi:hypothetical protein
MITVASVGDKRDRSMTIGHAGDLRAGDGAFGPEYPGPGARPAADRSTWRTSSMLRQLWIALVSSALLLAVTGSGVAAGGPPATGFYVDGIVYDTVGTPTDLSGTGAPPESFDRIYALGGALLNVAEAAPGDRDYNGGRWLVLGITWADGVTPTQLTSAEEVESYARAGLLSIGTTPLKEFTCPVIKAH